VGLPQRRCEACRFWDEIVQEHYHEKKRTGYCRFHAPGRSTLYTDSSQAFFPTTLSDDWCGQWQDNSALPVQERKKGDLLSAEEAGAWVGLHPATLRKLACQREITSFKVRGALRFKKEDLEGLIVERPAQKAK